MIIINPLTFAEVRIDETKLTEEQAEIFRRMTRRIRLMNKLYGKEWLDITKLEDDTKMKFMDVLKKITI